MQYKPTRWRSSNNVAEHKSADHYASLLRDCDLLPNLHVPAHCDQMAMSGRGRCTRQSDRDLGMRMEDRCVQRISRFDKDQNARSSHCSAAKRKEWEVRLSVHSRKDDQRSRLVRAFPGPPDQQP